MKDSLTRIIAWSCIGILLLCLVYVSIQAAHASDPHKKDHDHGDTTDVQYLYLRKDNNTFQAVAITAIATCAIISIYRKQWCWEPTKDDPPPNPGPAVVTPELNNGVRLYQ